MDTKQENQAATKANERTQDSTSLQDKTSKLKLYSFIENLFKIKMSEDVLVDMIVDEDSDENNVVIVGRPKLLGSATKQMRHVTPYSFIEYAIKSVIMDTAGNRGYLPYIENMIQAIQPLIKSKTGICLTREQYCNLLLSVSLQDQDEVDKVFKFTTVTPEQQKNEYHLAYNDTLIEAFNKSNLGKSIKQQAFDNFNSKFEKYISYGISHLNNQIDPKDPNIVTMACEGFARIILTMFNQDKYAAFPQEGNSLLEEIRLYTNEKVERENRKTPLQIQEQKKVFKVRSHAEITEEIGRSLNRNKEYDLRIRIVDNEGIKVRNTAEALRILNRLISSKASGHANIERIKQDENNYNEKYNLKVKMEGVNQHSYDNKISIEDNLDDVFHHHVAKHLYVVFDFKPLEKKVLAPHKRNGGSSIKVYPSATGKTTAEYSVQLGSSYREFQYNSRKGYNDKAIFRSEMISEKIKEALCKKIVSHIIISLIPFQSIKKGPGPGDDTQAGMKKVFESFLDLVQKDYQNAKLKDKKGLEVDLNDNWKNRVREEYGRVLPPSTTLDISGVSHPEEENYIQF